MALNDLFEKIPAAYNRAQRRYAEKEMKNSLSHILPIIEGYFSSEKTDQDFDKYRKSFENIANDINRKNIFIKVNTMYFISEVSVAEGIDDLKTPTWYKYVALSILIFIAIVIMLCIFLYICDV